MATAHIELQLHGGRTLSADWRLELAALAGPVAWGGRDWLLLQGRTDAMTATAHAAWVTDGSGPLDDLLRLELRPPRGQRLWTGALPRRELARIAARGALARVAAGIWPEWSTARGDRLRCRLGLGDDDATAPDFAPLPLVAATAAVSSCGIAWQAAPAATPTPPPITATATWRVHDRLLDADRAHPDLVLAFRPPIWDAVRALGAESAHRHEERGLLLYGRRLRLRLGAEYAPWFDVTAVERPQHDAASATALVLAHQPLLPRRDGAVFVGMLHTHLQGVGVEPSDPDRRDVEDLDHGGPAAVSLICEALPRAAAAAPRLRVLCRLGRRGGRIDLADARVLVAEPIARPTQSPRPAEVSR